MPPRAGRGATLRRPCLLPVAPTLPHAPSPLLSSLQGGHNAGPPGGLYSGSLQGGHGAPGGDNAANTTIFVGGLDSSIGDDELRRHFSFFGAPMGPFECLMQSVGAFRAQCRAWVP